MTDAVSGAGEERRGRTTGDPSGTRSPIVAPAGTETPTEAPDARGPVTDARRVCLVVRKRTVGVVGSVVSPYRVP